MLGRFDDAIAQYDSLTKLYGGFPAAWFHRAECDVARGDLDAARRHYDRFMQLYSRADADAPLLLAARDRIRQLNR
jgi:tetratricopeptide (TPR) repeat protein